MSVVTKLYISETQISSHEIEANGEIIKKGGGSGLHGGVPLHWKLELEKNCIETR